MIQFWAHSLTCVCVAAEEKNVKVMEPLDFALMCIVTPRNPQVPRKLHYPGANCVPSIQIQNNEFVFFVWQKIGLMFMICFALLGRPEPRKVWAIIPKTQTLATTDSLV